jgi:uncharacterized membrane protein
MGNAGRGTADGQLRVGKREHKRTGRGEQPRPVSNSDIAGAELAHMPSIELRHGPIPDAEELVRYGEAHPDAPAIILAEFQAQAIHRRVMEQRGQVMEQRELDAAIASERLGLACALLIALVGFGSGTYLIATGHGVEGTIIFGLDVVALVSAFILGRSNWEPPPPRKQ